MGISTTDNSLKQSSSKASGRIISLDFAKAICIVLVVIGHSQTGGAPDWWQTIVKVIYSFHMPLFMFASGYIYFATKKETGYWDFLFRKVKRLMIPYFTTSVIIISFKFLSQRHVYVESPLDAFSYFRMFYQPEAGYFLWFVWALWWMFMLVPLFNTKRSRSVLFLISVIIHYIPHQLTGVFCLNEFKEMLIYFMLGVIVCEYKTLQSFVMGFNKYKALCIAILFCATEFLYCSKIFSGGQIASS